jgi:hypothetical protein
MNKIFCIKTIKKITPQTILSCAYLFISVFILIAEHGRGILFNFFGFPYPLILISISLFFSHMLITNYVKNNIWSVFWKNISSLNSSVLLFSILAMGASV